jgi:hypothetical protein
MISSTVLSISLLSSTVFGVAINSDLQPLKGASPQKACVFPPPASALQAANAPDISGLDSECAKSIWCKLNGLTPNKDYVQGEYIASLKPGVSRDQANDLFESNALKGSSKPKSLSDSVWNLDRMPKFFSGKWNYTQVCYLEKRPEVCRRTPNIKDHMADLISD